jgi:hypothetical protein
MLRVHGMTRCIGRWQIRERGTRPHPIASGDSLVAIAITSGRPTQT